MGYHSWPSCHVKKICTLDVLLCEEGLALSQKVTDITQFPISPVHAAAGAVLSRDQISVIQNEQLTD